MDETRRKQIRLPNWDYGSNSCYHVTICTKNRRPIFGAVCHPDDALAASYVDFTPAGSCCENVLKRMTEDDMHVSLFNYVVMPNHVHLLVWIRPETESGVTLQSFVRFLKASVTKEARKLGVTEQLWQKSYYETIVRDERAFESVWEYIDANPSKWHEDEYRI